MKNKKRTILIVFGTRPEAIKMAPLILALKASVEFDVVACSTGQHTIMVDDALSIFDVKPDVNLNCMNHNNSLSELTSVIISKTSKLISELSPSIVFVHGDTASTLSATLAAYFNQIPVAHVEAGLRTDNIYSPWPEEGNRQLVSRLASVNFVPTKVSRDNLICENINDKKIVISGNTVIDALFFVRDLIFNSQERQNEIINSLPNIDFNNKFVLVTTHRRENFGDGLEAIIESIVLLSKIHQNIQFVLPLHLNPNVKLPIENALSSVKNVVLINPQDYISFVYLMMNSILILTDSGGIQEEAPALGVPVLLMRDNTERPEVLNNGSVTMVGTNSSLIVSKTSELINDSTKKINNYNFPFGDGTASKKIMDWLINNV